MDFDYQFERFVVRFSEDILQHLHNEFHRRFFVVL